MNFQDKVCVFIGGASELATATGKKLVAEKANVILIHHNQESLDRVVQDYPPGSIDTYIADVRDYYSLSEQIEKVVERHKKIDILINFAGIINHKPIDEMSIQDWQSVIDVNLNGAFYACKAVAPVMKKNLSGRIINISSVAGRTGRPGVGVNYAASKAGMIGLSQTLARELSQWHITVNTVAPGPLKGRMFSSMPPDLKSRLQAGIPLGRVGELNEVAAAILFLASDEAGWITGETLDVNGGVYI